MTSIISLQRKMQALTEEVRDIFHATSLNLQALLVQSEDNPNLKQSLKEIEKDFQHAKDVFNNRQELRLNYLITEQIKQEEAKVRRERLMEYEEKIYDQRRLISDKQAFYESLLRPKRKKPQNITPQQFQQLRRKELLDEENRNLQLLAEQIAQLEQLEGLIEYQNKKLTENINTCQADNKNRQIKQPVLKLARKNPNIYALMKKNATNPNWSQLKEIVETIYSVKQHNSNLAKQMKQQIQMQEYLKWQHQKLVQEYKASTNTFKKQILGRQNYIFNENNGKPHIIRAVSL